MTKEEVTKKKNLTLIIVTLMVTMLLASLSQMIFSSALPTIVGELNGVEYMSWVITAYMLASTVMMPVYGKVSDIFGRKPLLITAISLFLIGSVLGAVAQSMSWLIFARLVQGLGGGGLMILSQAAIADVTTARERGKYMGIMGGVFAVSSVAGPVLGGWLTEGIGWRWGFILNIPLALLALASVVKFLRLPKTKVSKQSRSELDYGGMALLAVTTAAFILTTTWGGSTYAWTSSQIVGLIVVTIIGAVLFVRNELRAKQPIIPMGLFKKKNFILATGSAMLVSVAMFGAIGYMPTYFQMAVGVSASVAGLMMTPMMGAMLITSIISGVLVSKTGRYKFFPIVGTGILAVGLSLLSTVQVETHIALICLYMAVIGVGLGMSMQILTLIVQNTFPRKMVGTATAANNYFRQVGSSFGAAVVGSVFASRLAEILSEKLPQAVEGGSMDSLTPALLASLPEAVRMPIVEAYNGALIPIFTYLVPLAILACVALMFLREKKLSDKLDDNNQGGSAISSHVMRESEEGSSRSKLKEKNA